jgi:hypothetical protein
MTPKQRAEAFTGNLLPTLPEAGRQVFVEELAEDDPDPVAWARRFAEAGLAEARA